MNRRLLLLTPLLIAVTLLLTACPTGGGASVSVDIDAPTNTIALDGRTQLTATVTGTSNTSVEWSGSNGAVATVDSDGIVVAAGQGTVRVTATSVADPTASDSVEITVGDFSVTSVTPSTSSASVQVGATVDLDATVTTTTGTSQAVIWSSGDTGTATVDGDGVVTGVAAGATTITVRAAADTQVSATIALTVTSAGGGGNNPNVTGISIDNPPPGNTLPTGVTRDLDATVTGTGSFSQNVIWSSSQTSVATINGDGEVTGVGAGTTEITATAADNATVSDSFVLTVTEVADCSSPTDLNDINADTSLPFGCYSVDPGDVVSVSAALTLAPGTIIEFGQSARLNVAFGGTLVADGSTDQPIVMRGANASVGFWDGIEIDALSGNSLSNVRISDAGENSYAAIYLQSTGGVSVTDTVISNSTIGFYAENGATIGDFADNTFSGNALIADIGSGVIGELDAGSDYAGATASPNTANYISVGGGVAGAGTWPAANAPFRIDAGTVLSVEGAVAVSPGAVLEFASSARLRIQGSGAIDATGTASDPIVFRGASAGDGFWDGIEVRSSGNVFDFVEISDAGSNSYAGIYATDAAAGFALSNATVSTSTIGVLASNNADITGFANNAFSANTTPLDIGPVHMASLDAASDYAGAGGTANTNNYISVAGGDTGAGTWPATNAPFRIDTGTVVAITGAVTASPGAVFEFGSSARLRVDAGATLDASGASGNLVTFRGASPTAGYWDGIEIRSVGNTFDYAEVSDGGSNSYSNIYITNGGSVTVTNSVITDSSDYGIELLTGSISPATEEALKDPLQGNNTFSGNASGDVNANIPPN